MYGHAKRDLSGSKLHGIFKLSNLCSDPLSLDAGLIAHVDCLHRHVGIKRTMVQLRRVPIQFFQWVRFLDSDPHAASLTFQFGRL